MPCDYSKYPANWFTEIRPAVLERAGHKCEVCGLKNYSQGFRDASGKFYSIDLIWDALELSGYDYFQHELSNQYFKDGNPKPPIRIILTISHLDHNLNNNDLNNLKALCQRCHLRHDIELHKASRKRNKGIIELF